MDHSLYALIIPEHSKLQIRIYNMERGDCVCILTNERHTVLYIGVTSDLQARIQEHKSKLYPNSFTAKYNCNKLVYFECFHAIEEAIAREKNLKNWKKSQERKIDQQNKS